LRIADFELLDVISRGFARIKREVADFVFAVIKFDSFALSFSYPRKSAAYHFFPIRNPQSAILHYTFPEV
jgi:hypothetical protein